MIVSGRYEDGVWTVCHLVEIMLKTVIQIAYFFIISSYPSILCILEGRDKNNGSLEFTSSFLQGTSFFCYRTLSLKYS